jgi:hypothetical protein
MTRRESRAAGGPSRRRARVVRTAAALLAVLAFLGAAPDARAAARAPADATSVAAGREWDVLLSRHVHGDRVDYDGVHRDRSSLTRYLESLAAPRPGLSRNEEIALWINAYNAATLDLVARERAARRGRLSSIKDIPAPWSRPRWTVLGAARTLDEMEHEILRKRFREPRIHFALVCASRSCPALRPTAYTGAFLDAQLDSAAREFILDPTRNRFEPENGTIRISKIFDWYAKDFAGKGRGDEAWIRLYGPKWGPVLALAARSMPASNAAVLRSSKHRVEILPYDWTLNSTGNAR